MRLIKARKLKYCKKCYGDIWPSDYYYPQRRKKSLCFSCGKSKYDSLLGRFLNWIGGHGESL